MATRTAREHIADLVAAYERKEAELRESNDGAPSVETLSAMLANQRHLAEVRYWADLLDETDDPPPPLPSAGR